MKRVSFPVAKALKEAGYKFNPAPASYLTNKTNSWFDKTDGELYSLPTYFEIWRWLWKEKSIRLEIEIDQLCIFSDYDYYGHFDVDKDPEEPIIAAIEYLVANNLIK